MAIPSASRSGARNCRNSVKAMLEKNLEGKPITKSPARKPIKHDNVRGSDYYN
jgi:hypothetical protein